MYILKIIICERSILFFAAKITSETDSSDKTEDGGEIDEVQQTWWHRKRWVTMAILIEPRHEKTNILVSDLVRHKPGCTATEDG